MSSSSRGETEIVSAPPVFFLHEEAPDEVTHVDVCQAAERLVGFASIVGAQRLGGLWRLYPTTREVRAKLLTVKLLMQGKSIPLRSQNPFAVRDNNGREIPSTRVTVDGLPISVANADLEGYLRKAGASFRSPLQWEKARDSQGKLTRWVTGRRFVWIDLPATPLPHKIQIGTFMARIFYREQPRPAPVCFACGREGHRKGDRQCQGPGPSSITACEPEAEDRGHSDSMESVSEDSSDDGKDSRDGRERKLKESEANDITFTKQNESATEEEEEEGNDEKTTREDVEKAKNKVKKKKQNNRKGGEEVKAKSPARSGIENSEAEKQGKQERGRPAQTTLDGLVHRVERAPSKKRSAPASDRDEPREAQRPKT